jgi:type VI secretion system protein ImpJ
MRNLPVHWSEGMFLRPHHLQAADRYWAEVSHTSEQWDHEYNYGLRTLDYSKEALVNFQFEVHRCDARLRDGTLVSLGADQDSDRIELKTAIQELETALERVDLQQAFEVSARLQVYLAIPKLKLGTPNVALPSDGNDHELHRYHESEITLQDESRGGNDQEVRVRRLNVKLILSSQPRAGYEYLPIAELERAGPSNATPQLTAYIPPLLAIDAWPPLAREVRAIYDVVGNKLQLLSEQVLNRGLTLASQEPGDLDRLWMLAQLNESYATLGVLTFARGVHPFAAYTELCRLVGKLSIFGPERRAPEVPRYDHDDLASIFAWVKEHIYNLLNAIVEHAWEQRYFVRAGLGMQVSLKPVWLNPDWRWYVGVSTTDISEVECRELLTGAGQLDWKLGSANQVEIIFKQGREGLLLVSLDRTPAPLPVRGWMYYEVTRQNAAWKDVQDTQTLAMRFRDSLVNKAGSADDRTLIVNYRGKRIALQFALFAVPSRT